MISVHLNDTMYQINPAQSLHEFLIKQNYIDLHFAVAINNKLVPRVNYQSYTLKDGDRVDIIIPMQGG